MTHTILEEQIAIFRKFYNDNEAGGSSRWLVAPNIVEVFLRSFYLAIIEGVEKEVEGMKQKDHSKDCQRRMEKSFRRNCDCGTYWINDTLSDLQARLAKRKGKGIL